MQGYTITRNNAPDGKKITITISVESSDDMPFAIEQMLAWIKDTKSDRLPQISALRQICS